MQKWDLIVVGAGPAGASAALAASSTGMKVAVVDENAAPGGQIYRAPRSGKSVGALSVDDRAGADLRARLAASDATILCDARVWLISDRFRVDIVRPDGSLPLIAPRLVAATGAHERIVPFPGWQLPGVIGLAGATILLKSQGVLPGQRCVVAGCGPLLASVASKIIEKGGDVVAIADLSSRSEWLAAVPAMLGRFDILKQGLGWALKIARRRIPIFFRHTILRADGVDGVERVTLAPVNAQGDAMPGPAHTFAVDALAVGHGLLPGGDIPRMLRADQSFDAQQRVWRTKCDADGRTSVAGLYAAGDGAQVRGALPASLAGERAGLAAAFDAGFITGAEHVVRAAAVSSQQTKAHVFSDAINHLMRPRPGLAAGIAPDTIVCRCEDVQRKEIDAAIAAGAADMNQLKHFTRCGMGPCQGRSCGDAVAEILGQHIGRERAGYWTARPPLRPVPLADLIGEFSYADIPVPKPAPL